MVKNGPAGEDVFLFVYAVGFKFAGGYLSTYFLTLGPYSSHLRRTDLYT